MNYLEPFYIHSIGSRRIQCVCFGMAKKLRQDRYMNKFPPLEKIQRSHREIGIIGPKDLVWLSRIYVNRTVAQPELHCVEISGRCHKLDVPFTRAEWNAIGHSGQLGGERPHL